MIQFLYLLKVSVCSGILLSYYFLVLRNKIYHQYNRFYLLLVAILSWIIPLINFSIFVPQNKLVYKPIYQAISYIQQDNLGFESNAILVQKNSFTTEQLLTILYVFIGAIIAIFTLISILKIRAISKKYTSQKLGNITLVLTQESNTPFSFFNTIFWNKSIDINSTIGSQILQHEFTHIHQKHSWDKVFMQLNCIAGWCNPFFWLIKSELAMIHEFIADKKSVPNSNMSTFAEMLLTATFPSKNFALSNPFFFSPIQRRIIMIAKNTLPKFSYLQRIIALPLLTLSVILFSFTIKKGTKNNASLKTNLNKKYKIVIDAGHGGQDLGATAKDGITHEKDIALAIAQQIKIANTNQNIDIVLSRNDDHYDNVQQKAEFVNANNADAMVSIHCNNVEGKINNSKGTEIYIVSPEKNKGNWQQSNLLAQSVNSFLLPHFNNRGIKSRQVGIWILEATKCPSILVLPGFISNKDDLKILTNKEKQAAIATDILHGIENYFATKESGEVDTILKDTATKAISIEELETYKKIASKYENSKLKYKFEFDKVSHDDYNLLLSIFLKMSKQQQNVQNVHFRKPLPIAKNEVPSNEEITKWKTNKLYGIWIDNKRVTNQSLSKFTANSFLHYNVSKLYANAIGEDGHTVQVNLMTTNYYKKYIEQRKAKANVYYLWYRQGKFNFSGE
jgi:N-acetylmuramoyl-L-alanine amidase